MLAKSTNGPDTVEFLRQIRQAVDTNNETEIKLILDNAKAHHALLVKETARRLNIDLVFQPPYSPEFNCCEPMWSVLKRRFKGMMAE